MNDTQIGFSSLLIALLLVTGTGEPVDARKKTPEQEPGTTASRVPDRAADSPECKSVIDSAASLFGRGKSMDALDLLSKNKKLCAGSDRYYVLLSTILLRQPGSQAKAAAAAGEAVRLAPDSQTAHLQLGVCLMAAGDNTGAARAFESLTGIDPTSYEAWSALANLYTELGDNEKARSCASKAACLEPESRAARLRTIASLHSQGQMAAMRQELKSLVADDSLEPEFFIVIAEEAERRGAHQEALKATERVLSRYPNNRAVLAVKAKALYFSKRYKESLRIAGALPGGNTDSQALVALCQLKLGKSSEARKSVESIFKSTPDTDEPLALLARGVIESQDGLYKKALDSLQSALKDNQLFAPAHIELARIYLKQEDIDQAISEAREAARSLDSQASARALEARAVLIEAPERQKMEKALALSGEALKKDADNPEALLARSLCDLKGGHVSSARAAVDRVLAQEPGNVEATVISARILEAEGKGKASLGILEKAHAMAPGEADVVLALADYYRNQGSTQKAIAALRNGTGDGKTVATVAFELAKLLRDEGKEQEAGRFFQLCLEDGIAGPKASAAKQALKELK